VDIAARMCEVLSPRSWRPAEQGCVPRLGLGAERMACAMAAAQEATAFDRITAISVAG
jgi:hypothetical protein